MSLSLPLIIGLAAQYAPNLIRRLAGPKAGTVADRIANVAKEVTGATSIEDAQTRLVTDPALAVQLRVRLAEVELDEERLEQEDRANARGRDVEVRKIGTNAGQNRRADVMLAMAFAAVLAIAGMVTWLELTGRAAMLAVGFLTTIGGMFARNIGTAFDFEFGSSRSSREKDQALGEIAKGP